jgi:hypothetical protein
MASRLISAIFDCCHVAKAQSAGQDLRETARQRWDEMGQDGMRWDEMGQGLRVSGIPKRSKTFAFLCSPNFVARSQLSGTLLSQSHVSGNQPSHHKKSILEHG